MLGLGMGCMYVLYSLLLALSKDVSHHHYFVNPFPFYIATYINTFLSWRKSTSFEFVVR